MPAQHDHVRATWTDDADDLIAFSQSLDGSIQAAFASLDAANTSSSSFNSSDVSRRTAVPTAAQRQPPKAWRPIIAAGARPTASAPESQWDFGGSSLQGASQPTSELDRLKSSRGHVGSSKGQSSARPSLSAKRRQDASPSGPRPLSGGRSFREMQERAQSRRKRHDWAIERAMLQEEERAKAQAPPSVQVRNDSETSTHLHTLGNESPPPHTEPVVAASQPSLGVSASDAATQRRPPARSLSWSARRDKRDARRRPSPPLTRRRAQAKGVSVSDAAPLSSLSVDTAPPQSTPRAREKGVAGLLPPFSSNDTCDITDPSNDDLYSTIEYAALAKAREEDANRRKTVKRARKPVRPALDLTLTEPVQGLATFAAAEHAAPHSSRASSPASVAIDHAGYSSDTQASSETQSSQPEPSGLTSSAVDDVVLDAGRPPALAGSDTEDECENAAPHRVKPKALARLTSEPSAAQRRPSRRLPAAATKAAAPKKRRSGGHGGERASKAPAKAAAVKAQPRPVQAATRRRGPVVPRGAPLFDGSKFILLGFFARVKIIEKLIIKHSGATATRPKDQTDPNADPVDGVTHIVYCPHAAFKPDRVRVSQAVLDWCDGRTEQAESVLQACSTTDAAPSRLTLLDANWISDCIAGCLRQDELLSFDKYRITV